MPTPQEWTWVIGLWELAHKKSNNTRPKVAQQLGKHIIHTSQTTLPHRGSSHRFYGNKQKRAGVSRLPLAFQKQIL